jgi:hypothetical protein
MTPNVPPKILSAVELMALEIPEPRWAVPELIPEGLTIFAGRPKLGKSWLMLGLAIAVAGSGRALGQIKVTEGDVLYIALEDSAKRLQQRIETQLAGSTPPSRLHLAREWPRGEGGVAQLEAWLNEHPQARLIIVDTLVRFRAESRRDRSYDSDYADLGPLQRLAIMFGIAIVVVHHVRKLPADDWIDTLSGTLGLAGAADGLLGLFRVRGESQAVLKTTGRDVEEQELGVRFNPETCSWALLGSAETTVMLTAERQAVLTGMSCLVSGKSGLVSARHLAVHLKKSIPATVKLLQRLQGEGLVVSSRGKEAGWRLAHEVSGMSWRPNQDKQDTEDTRHIQDRGDISI